MKRAIISVVVTAVALAAAVAVIVAIHALTTVPSAEAHQENFTYAADEVSSINIDVNVAFVSLYETSGNFYEIEFIESREGLYKSSVTDGTLTLSESDSSFFDKLFRSDSDRFGINIGIPKDDAVTFSVSAQTSELTAEGVSFAGDTEIVISDGSVSFNKVSASGYVSVDVENGNVSLDGLECTEVSAEVVYGDIFFRNVNAEKAILLSTDSGKVSGFIYGSRDNYKITATVDTGVSELESGGDGPVELIINVGKGSIAVK